MLESEEIEKRVENNELNQRKISKKVNETDKKVKKVSKDTSIKKSKSTNVVSKTKLSKKEKDSDKKVNEATVIEKIKEFIAKIAAMQEEASKEATIEKEKSENTKAEKTRKTVRTRKSKVDYMLEYYDLPYRYNETVVKILAQTPKRLFVYWDIADSDKEKYIKTFGEDFFEKTYPVLLVYNENKKFVKEVTINDFANSWYIEVPNSKTKYTIQLGRKFRDTNKVINIEKARENNIIVQTDYLPFANSNVLEVPNDHVLLESLPKFIIFRNVKTNKEVAKELKNIKGTIGNSYDVKDFYENEYKDGITEGIFDMTNPSSSFKLSSSTFK